MKREKNYFLKNLLKLKTVQECNKKINEKNILSKFKQIQIKKLIIIKKNCIKNKDFFIKLFFCSMGYFINDTLGNMINITKDLIENTIPD